MTKYDHYYNSPFTILEENKQYQLFLCQQNVCYLISLFSIDYHLDCKEKTLQPHYQHLKCIEQGLQAFYLLSEILYKILPNVLLDYDILCHEQLD